MPGLRVAAADEAPQRANASGVNAIGREAAEKARRELFGFDEPKDVPATCETAESLPCPVDLRPVRERMAPAAWTTRLTRQALERLPLATADLDGAAGLAVGAGRDDAGVHYAGATSVDNRVLVDGAAVESPRTGALDTRVPLLFVDELVITSGGFSVRDRAATGAVIDARLREGGDAHLAEGGLWLGVGAPARLTTPVAGEYRSFQGHLADRRSLEAGVVASGPVTALGAMQLWYAGGVAPRLFDGGLVRHAWRRADRDGNNLADVGAGGVVVHESLGTIERGALAWSVPVMARLGARSATQRIAATALVTSAGDTRWTTTAEESAAGVDRRVLDALVTAGWRGDFGRTRIELRGAWQRQRREESPRSAAGDVPALGLAYVAPPDAAVGGGDGAVRAGCADGGDGDPYPGIINCPFPVGYYQVAGAGQLDDVTQDRPSLFGEVEHAHGEHTVALGASGEDARVVLGTRFSGGVLRRQLGTDAFIDYRFVELGAGPDSCGDATACRWLTRTERTLRTRQLAAWLSDTWRPGDTVTVEGGVRWERSQVGESLKVQDVLPRIAASWDVLGEGRSRLFAGWGRYAALLPAGVGESLFAGPAIYQQLSFGGVVTHAIGQSGDLDISDDVQGVRVDEVLGGVEAGLADVVRVALMGRYRHLGRTLEDVDGVVETVGADGGARATRDFTEIALTFQNAPEAVVHVRVGYAWSRLRGNWPGAYDPSDGFGLYLSTAFDATAVNATGALPNDQPHRFFAEISGRGERRGWNLDAAVRATLSSGRPVSYRTTAGQVFLIARGAGGRTPTVAQTNLRLAARRGRLTVSLDLLNAFHRRGVTAVDDLYVLDPLAPISGGDERDLVFAKDNVVEGAPARVNRRYGAPSRFQAPVLGLLGVAIEL